MFHSKVSVDKFKFDFVKNLNRQETKHIDHLEKAQGKIIQRAEEEKTAIQDAKKEEAAQKDKKTKGGLLETAKYDQFDREDDDVTDQSKNPRDKKRKAIILLQRLIRGRAD